jgi:hypothetical protein
LHKHLRGPRQKSFYHVSKALEPLRRNQQSRLNAHNMYARANFWRALTWYFCAQVGAKPPRFIPRMPVYFVTVVDHRQTIYPDQTRPGEPDQGPSFWQMRSAYWDVLRGLNYVGTVEPSLYVSAQRTHDVSWFLQFHAHVLVWGITEEALEKVLDENRSAIGPLLPYAKTIDIQLIEPKDLLQMLWYSTKAPRKQYQLWNRPTTGTLKQFKRDINGVNSVRVYQAMKDVTLDQLALAGGEGTALLERSLRAARQRGRPAPTDHNLFGKRPRPRNWSTCHPVLE